MRLTYLRSLLRKQANFDDVPLATMNEMYLFEEWKGIGRFPSDTLHDQELLLDSGKLWIRSLQLLYNRSNSNGKGAQLVVTVSNFVCECI